MSNKVAWAFGLGLDRLVMMQYAIPDIRLLWSEDERFLDQFAFDNPDTPVTFKVNCGLLCVLLLLNIWYTVVLSKLDTTGSKADQIMGPSVMLCTSVTSVAVYLDLVLILFQLQS